MDKAKYVIRLAKKEDLPEMKRIFDAAKQRMRADGNTKQWTGNYPSDELLLDDIAGGNSYVVEREGRIAATFVMIVGEDPTYKIIYDGAWIDDVKPYATIHRIASLPENKGVAAACFDFAWEKTHNLRVDTHRDNLRMRHIAESYGFVYCGIIHLANGDERLAYQKIM
jgi:hypothetical protein